MAGEVHITDIGEANKDWRTKVDCRSASKTWSRSSNRDRAVMPPSWLNWLAVKMVMSPDMNRRNARGIVRQQLGRGVHPFLFAVTEVEASGDGIHRVGNDRLAGRQRPFANGVIDKCRGRRGNAVGQDQFIRRVIHFRAMVEPLVDDGFDRIVILGFDGLFNSGSCSTNSLMSRS